MPSSSAYRQGRPQLVHALEARLGPFGFVVKDPDAPLSARGFKKLFHRKTWNTNRGVVVLDPGAKELRDAIESARAEAGAFLGSSWWSQLGLQVVLVYADASEIPAAYDLEQSVDAMSTQGVLIQSVFAVELTTGRWSQGRTWGQVISGKFQEAIQLAIEEVVGER